MTNIKEQSDRKRNMDRRINRKKILVPGMIAAAAAIITVMVSVLAITYDAQHDRAAAQNTSLRDIANSVKPVFPQAMVSQGKLDNVNGVALSEVGRSVDSQSIVRDNGVSSGIQKQGQAEITISKATADGDDIIAVTVTNVGKDRFYLKELAIGGGTATGLTPITSTALDADYSEAVYGSIPKPTLTTLVTMNPGGSLSAYIKVKYDEQLVGQPITQFGASALYYYDKSAPDYNNGFNWSISAAFTPQDDNGSVFAAINPNTNRIYVANEVSHTVSVVDGNDNAKIASIQVGA
jgi:YVTN family beta-propeller protein